MGGQKNKETIESFLIDKIQRKQYVDYITVYGYDIDFEIVFALGSSKLQTNQIPNR